MRGRKRSTDRIAAPRPEEDGGDASDPRDTPPMGVAAVRGAHRRDEGRLDEHAGMAGVPPAGDDHGEGDVGTEPDVADEGNRGADEDEAGRRADERAEEGAGGGGSAEEAHRPGGTRRAARHRRKRSRWWLAAAIGVPVAVVASFVTWVEVEAHPSGAPGAAVVVSVREGEPTGTVLAQLADRGVIGSSLAFRAWSVVQGMPTVLPGTYLFHRNLSFGTVQRRLQDGPNVFRLDVVAGMTLAEIDARLSSFPHHLARTFAAEAKKGAVRSPYAPASGASLEGLIGTGSYEIMPGENAHQLLAQMVSRFDAEARAAGLKPTTVVDGLSPYEVVTTASIAQKEGYFTRYFGKVARVIYNRLARHMNLEMTSTVLYSLGQDGGPVTPAEELITTPYNTYLHAGLTPTPICTPSAAALAAAVAPPEGAWLYFDLVTAKKGIMVFSATYTGQQAAEQQKAAQQKTGQQ